MALFLLAAAFGRVLPAAAQGEGALVLGAPDTSYFPSIQFYLDAYDADGGFIDSLKLEDLKILENGQTIAPRSIQQVQNGMQIIIALNTGSVMSKQFGAVSGYQLIQKALIDWASSQPVKSNPRAVDDFSFSTPTGLFLIREHDPSHLVKAITDYKPDLTNPQPVLLGSLAEALDLATDPLDQPNMKRSILYITPTMPTSITTTLSDLAKRAQGSGVQLNIWQVMDASAHSAGTAANPLKQMAESTGGKYEEINFANPLPAVEPLFQPFRQTYQVQYTSAINKSGSQTLSVQVLKTGIKLSSKESHFNLTVQPPNPIFLSPPETVQRYWTSSGVVATPALAPEAVAIQIMVEFPDQHRRALKATRLYANGVLVAENKAEPFDTFSWPIDAVTASSRQMLRVEAVDSLNLSGTSIEIPIEVEIDQSASAKVAEQISPKGMIAVGAVAAAGLILTLVLVFTGTQRRWRRAGKQVDKRLLNDPVTQPVNIRQEHSRPAKKQQATGKPVEQKIPVSKPARPQPMSAWSNSIWSRGNGQNSTPARLVALDENEQPITGGVIPLTRQEITFGRDPQRATQVLESLTVNELHARLYRSPDGGFYLADQGSIAGTWINYTPAPSSGVRLEHGDLIHIGKVMYRFELANPTGVEIKVISLEQVP